MKAQQVLTIALLLLVAGSLVWMAVGEKTAARQSGSEVATQSSPALESKKLDSYVVAYYFHGDVRCVTCRNMEAYADEAISQNFTGELASGTLEWRKVNVDDAAHRHFITDFNLSTRSMVLARYEDGNLTAYENLEAVWSLSGDKSAFIEYVVQKTREMVESSS